eukprot:3224248-Pleurochrysis_carterae.AAC.2
MDMPRAPLSTTKPILRRPSRRCLLRRGAFRRALDAINAWLRVAIGADKLLGHAGDGDDTAVSGTVTCDDVNALRRHVASMEGKAIAKSTEASLNCSSVFSRMQAVSAISLGAHTSKCLIAPVARSNAGLKSMRDT